MAIERIGDGSITTCSAETLGAKAANLARMAALGLPVPPAFVLPVSLCAAIMRGDPDAGRDMRDGLREGIRFLEAQTGTVFGDPRRPLLVSVRSGAARSMPGMLDTVLDVGCTEAAIRGLVRMSGNPQFAWDCRARFLESYGGVVLGLRPSAFAQARAGLVAAEGVDGEDDFDCEAREQLAGRYRQAIEDAGHTIPDAAVEQLAAAAEAVYASWGSDRARTYRQLQHLDDLEGTAVTVQAMVFGNRGLTSGAGVAFSRDPSTGAPEPVIDVLLAAQGEDIVSGQRSPETEEALRRALPDVARELRDVLRRLEGEFRDVQDVEFTIETGRLWILQTRAAKRTPRAALRFAVDLAKEGLIAPEQALRQLEGVDLAALVEAQLRHAGNPVACGTSASAGVAVGRAAFDSAGAERLAATGDPVILLRPDTSTADVAGFAASKGIVTAVGGRTAHAALVARQLGKPCIVGCSALAVDAAGRRARLAATTVDEGDWLSIDGTRGAIYLGRGDIVSERPQAELAEVERWRGRSPSRPGPVVRRESYAPAP